MTPAGARAFEKETAPEAEEEVWGKCGDPCRKGGLETFSGGRFPRRFLNALPLALSLP